MKQTSHDIQQHAFKALQKDFSKAAKKASSNLTAMLKNADTICNTSLSHNGRLHNLQFLLKATQGEYTSTEAYGRCSGNLWSDYLSSLGRLQHGWGSFYDNIDTTDKLIKQNGPKKMEERLTGYLKRRITSAVKSCS